MNILISLLQTSTNIDVEAVQTALDGALGCYIDIEIASPEATE